MLSSLVCHNLIVHVISTCLIYSILLFHHIKCLLSLSTFLHTLNNIFFNNTFLRHISLLDHIAGMINIKPFGWPKPQQWGRNKERGLEGCYRWKWYVRISQKIERKRIGAANGGSSDFWLSYLYSYNLWSYLKH